MEAARLENRQKNITFTTFHPGFVDSEMTEKLAKRPFLVSSASCAKIMIKKVKGRAVESLIPFWPWILMKWFIHLLPDRFMKFFG